MQCWAPGEIQSLFSYTAGYQEVGDPGRLGQTPAFGASGIRELGLVNGQPRALKFQCKSNSSAE